MAPIFLKWAGGKAQSLARIAPHIPNLVRDYYEPFLGGGSVLFHVLQTTTVARQLVANDINPRLIHLYKSVQSDIHALLDDLRALEEEANNAPIAEEFYYVARDLYNDNTDLDTWGDALFVYLNHNGFRGLYRENAAGAFNVPFGHYQQVMLPSHQTFMQAHALFSNNRVTFECKNARELLNDAEDLGEEDLVFLDPPYEKIAPTTFVAYHAGGAHFDPENLCDWLETRGRRTRAIFTNHATDALKTRFQDFPVCEVFSARRAIHAHKPGARADELLVCTHPAQ
jgi:DNA adenine methylase